MTSLQWFRLLASEFSALSDAEVNALVTSASLLVSTNGLNSDQAAAALALYGAHLQWLTVNRTGTSSSAGNIKSEREGDLSRTYSSVSGDDTWIGQSPYGLQFEEIMKAATGGCIMTRYGIAGP